MASKKFDSRLVAGLNPKDRADAERFLATNFLIEKVREIIRAEREALVVSRQDYDSPGWAHKQAHFNGEYLAYTRVLKMLGEQEA